MGEFFPHSLNAVSPLAPMLRPEQHAQGAQAGFARHSTFMSNAMILCAGLGTRLRPLTQELPKPLVPVGDRSVLRHICDALGRAGLASAVVNSHWHSRKLCEYTEASSFQLKLIHEVEIRGVAGGIAGARALLDAPTLVWNGDVLIEDPPIAAMLERVERTGGVCLGVAASGGPGTVGIDSAGRVVRLRGETYGVEQSGVDYVGLVALGETALAQLPERGCLIGDYCMPRLASGAVVETCRVSSPWHDVGSLSGYGAANWHWLARQDGRAGASFVGSGATVARGVRLSQSVVGSGARVEGSGELVRCIVWPASTAVAPLSDAVVTPSQVVALGPHPY